MDNKDFRQWMTENLWKNIERVVNQKADYHYVYFIEVRHKNHYEGVAGANIDKPIKEMLVKGAKILSNRLVILNHKPLIPQLGTILFKVDNRHGKGDIYHVYTLPYDVPNQVEDSDNFGDVVETVAEGSKSRMIPLIFN